MVIVGFKMLGCCLSREKLGGRIAGAVNRQEPRVKGRHAKAEYTTNPIGREIICVERAARSRLVPFSLICDPDPHIFSYDGDSCQVQGSFI